MADQATEEQEQQEATAETVTETAVEGETLSNVLDDIITLCDNFDYTPSGDVTLGSQVGEIAGKAAAAKLKIGEGLYVG